MDAYLPTSTTVAAVVAALLLANLAWGFTLCRLPAGAARLLAWATVVAGVVAVHYVLAEERAGFRMLGLISVALLGMKTVVAVEAQARGMERLGLARWIGFTMTWPGMRPALFADKEARAIPGWGRLIGKGLVRLLAGVLLVVGARWTSGEPGPPWLTVVLLLTGLSLILHFGICNLLAGGWRLLGVRADSLFRAPLLSQSLGEFWARRWNLAFSEMTSIAVYRPLASRLGRGIALLAAFLLSGLLHEMAISLPVRAGLGLPLAYFAIHGMLVFVERVLESRNRPVHGAWGRVWTLGWVVAPLPILFHPPFLDGVVLPIIGG